MRMSKNLNVYISVEHSYRGKYWVNIDYTEAESGDTFGIATVADENGSLPEYDRLRVGDELASWIPLLIDELEDMEKTS